MTKVASYLEHLCFLVFSDAVFGVRADGSSQGGFFVLLTNKAALDGKQVRYNVLSWRSFKLTVVRRSSLAAEAQSLAAALGEMMLVRTLISLMVYPGQDPRAPARALYDALQKTRTSERASRSCASRMS